MTGFIGGDPCRCKRVDPAYPSWIKCARMDGGPDQNEVRSWPPGASATWRCEHGNLYLVTNDVVGRNGADHPPEIYGPVLHGPITLPGES